MKEPSNDSILGLLRREPEQTSLLLKIGLGGPFLILAWDVLGSMFLSEMAVLPFELLLILAYAGSLTFLIARLVHTADQWQIDSAMNARRILTGRQTGSSNAAAAETPAPVAPITPSAIEATPVRAKTPKPEVDFSQIYFMIRLEEEVQRARREGRQMSVLVLDIGVPGPDLTPDVVEKLQFDMAQMAASQAKTISLSINPTTTEFVFSLPHSDPDQTKSFVSKLVQALGNYWCHFGVGLYPVDATTGQALVDHARRTCEASHQDRGAREATKAAVA